MHRRDFLTLTSGALALAPVAPGVPQLHRAPIRAVLFDAFPIFDPRPIATLAESLVPAQGAALLAAWRTRQFEYTWLRATARQYRDFWGVTDDALVSAARSLRIALTSADRTALTTAYLNLKAWPDVPAALGRLRAAGIRVGLLSNFTLTMLEANLASADLRGAFQYVLSTDQARTYKPAPEAYQLGVDATGFKREEIAFAAFAGWDASGAEWFGYPTVWVNRAGSAPEELGGTPEAIGVGLDAVVDFVVSH